MPQSRFNFTSFKGVVVSLDRVVRNKKEMTVVLEYRFKIAKFNYLKKINIHY